VLAPAYEFGGYADLDAEAAAVIAACEKVRRVP
jgi:hypothetical protein